MLKGIVPARKQAGLSLVELMVAIVAGLIVIGGAMAFTVSTVRAYSENIQSTRLSQELRSGMNMVVRELRRAGYDGASTGRVLTTEETTRFRNLETPGSSCIVYEYDRGGSLGDDPVSTEKRAIRYDTSARAMQVLASGAGSDCEDAPGWVDLTDPKVINITAFGAEKHETPFCVMAPGLDTDGDGVKDRFDITTGKVTSVSLCLKGALVSDGSVERWMTDTVRIRADALKYPNPGTAFNIYSTEADAQAACAAIAPPSLPPTPSELNAECAAP